MIRKFTRYKIFERDKKCLCCGEKRRSLFTIDHIVPLSKGGSNGKRNLQTLCFKCNGKKGNKTIDYRMMQPKWNKNIKE